MAEIIHMADRWRIERQPGQVTDPMVVGFVKGGAVRKLLDQTARWTGNGTFFCEYCIPEEAP